VYTSNDISHAFHNESATRIDGGNDDDNEDEDEEQDEREKKELRSPQKEGGKP
jgi:hypothetical protein